MSGALPLTEKQEKLWRFIASCERSPTYDEMAAHMGVSGRGVINRMVCSLKERGFVRYLPCRARTIIAVEPAPDLSMAKTGDLIAELERRGISLNVRPTFSSRVGHLCETESP